MKLFLVDATIHTYKYMDDRTTEDDQQIVWADSAEQAQEKYKKFWEDKSDEYSNTYSVNYINAREAIQ
jgi:hypothetical protein